MKMIKLKRYSAVISSRMFLKLLKTKLKIFQLFFGILILKTIKPISTHVGGSFSVIYYRFKIRESTNKW